MGGLLTEIEVARAAKELAQREQAVQDREDAVALREANVTSLKLSLDTQLKKVLRDQHAANQANVEAMRVLESAQEVRDVTERMAKRKNVTHTEDKGHVK